MNYSKLFRGLLNEVKNKLQYKRLPETTNILVFIGVFPFVIMSALAFAFYAVLSFFYNALASAVIYLEKWVEDKKKDVKHATEAVLYFVTMPWIFFCNVLLSIGAVFFYFLWFFAQCVLYIATLGGIKWQPYITHAEYDEDVEWDKSPLPNYSATVGLCSFGLLAFYVLTRIIFYITHNSVLVEMSSYVSLVYTLFTVIAIPIAFKKSVVKVAEINEVKGVSGESSFADNESADVVDSGTKSDFSNENNYTV